MDRREVFEERRPLRRSACRARRRSICRDSAPASVWRLNRCAAARRARHEQVGQKVHFDLPHALPLALFAAAAGDVEAEAADLVAALLRLARGGEDLANLVEQAGVGRRVAARRAADRRLIDLDQLVDAAAAPRSFVNGPGFGPRTEQLAAHGAGERFVDQRTLARAAHAGHAGEHAERKLRRRRSCRLFVVAPSMVSDRVFWLALRRVVGHRNRQRGRER